MHALPYHRAEAECSAGDRDVAAVESAELAARGVGETSEN